MASLLQRLLIKLSSAWHQENRAKLRPSRGATPPADPLTYKLADRDGLIGMDSIAWLHA